MRLLLSNEGGHEQVKRGMARSPLFIRELRIPMVAYNLFICRKAELDLCLYVDDAEANQKNHFCCRRSPFGLVIP